MTWRIAWTETAFRSLSKLDKAVQRRILGKLEQVAVDPTRHFRPLAGKDEHKLRVGDHRVLAVLHHQEEVALVMEVGHRSVVYDR